MKQLNSPMTVVAFIIMPAPTSTFSVDSLKGQAVMKQLRETVSDVQNNIGKRIFEACARYVVVLCGAVSKVSSYRLAASHHPTPSCHAAFTPHSEATFRTKPTSSPTKK